MVIRYNLPPPDSMEEITVQHPMPIVGSYVVFSIDVLATLEAMDVHADSTTKKLAQEIPTHKYVAYVEQSLTIDVLSPWRALSLRPVHSTPPTSNGSLIDPDMYLPVLPSTSHPHSRRPLRPTKPLPWPTCFHHTTTPDMLVRVRGGIYTDPSKATELPFRDRKRHKATIDMDGERIVKRILRRRRSMGSTIYDTSSLLTSAGPATANGSIAPGWWEDAGLLSGSAKGSKVVETTLSPRNTDGEGIGTGTGHVEITITGPNDETNEYEDDDEDDDESVYTEQDHPTNQQNDHTAELYSTYAKPGGGSNLLHLTAVSVSYDLNEVDSILDPKGFYQELDQLMRIVEEGKERHTSILPLPLPTDLSNEPLTPITRDHQDQPQSPDTTGDITSQRTRTPSGVGSTNTLNKFRLSIYSRTGTGDRDHQHRHQYQYPTGNPHPNPNLPFSLDFPFLSYLLRLIKLYLKKLKKLMTSSSKFKFKSKSKSSSSSMPKSNPFTSPSKSSFKSETKLPGMSFSLRRKHAKSDSNASAIDPLMMPLQVSGDGE